METAQRRVYTPEFKAAAVELCRSGQSVDEVARAVDAPEPLVRTWFLQSQIHYAEHASSPQPKPLSQLPPPPAGASTVTVAPMPPPMITPPCGHCGRGPAIAVTLRSVTGIVIAFRMSRVKGTFCRDCGDALTRFTLNRTLITGWWGLFAGVANMYAAIVDLVALGKFRGLSAPAGRPTAEPLKPGRPLHQRAGVYVASLVMLLSTAGAVLAVIGSTPNARAFQGKCVAFGAEEVVAQVSCAAPHDGRVVAVVRDSDLCPDESDAMARLDAEASQLMCVDLDQ